MRSLYTIGSIFLYILKLFLKMSLFNKKTTGRQGLERGMNRSTKDFYGENTPFDIIIVEKRHYTFVQVHKMYRLKVNPM